MDKVAEVLAAKLEETPKGATRWSRASMARRSGLSESTIGRTWRKFELGPHLTDSFKLSTDPLFTQKVVDVVGLYHNPPERAVVLCVDEKTQVQAYPGDDPSVSDGGQEANMTDSRSVADVLSRACPQQSRRPHADDHAGSTRPHLPVSPRALADGDQHAPGPRHRCFCNGRVRNGPTCDDVKTRTLYPG